MSETTVIAVTPETPQSEPEAPAAEAVADAAESAADAATEIAATDAAARVEVAQIEADRDVAVAETNAAAAVAIATDQERITWLEERVRSLETTTSDLSTRLPLTPETPPETVTLEAVDPETGTTLTLQSTSPETNETLTEAIAESAGESQEAEAGAARRVKRRGFI